MNRRSLMRLGLMSAALLAAGGTVTALIDAGLDPGRRLTPASRRVVRTVGDALLDGSLPTDPVSRAHALQGMLDRTDALIAGLPPHAQAELAQLLSILGSAAGRRLLVGLQDDWAQAIRADVQLALQGMRQAAMDLRQQAYLALHEITGAAYFSSPDTWTALGYPGPRPVGTPS